MFNRQIVRTILVGAFAVLITIVIGVIFAESETLKHMRFWFVVGPIVASEILLTVSFCGLFGKSRNSAFPLRVGATVIPWTYFGFTLLMAALFFVDKISDNVIITLQLIAIFIVLIYVVAVEMAADTIQAHAAETAAADASRVSWRAMVDGILETLRGRFSGDKDMGKLFDQLYDAARYACDSVPGGEKAESELEEKLMRLEQSAGTDDAEAVKSAILQILSAFRKRESVMKALR
jgi:hypothetical protein